MKVCHECNIVFNDEKCPLCKAGKEIANLEKKLLEVEEVLERLG